MLPEFRKDPAGFLLRTAKTHGDLAYLRLGRQHVYFVSHPDSIRDILVTHQNNFTKSRMLERANVLLGDGLLTSEGEFHTPPAPAGAAGVSSRPAGGLRAVDGRLRRRRAAIAGSPVRPFDVRRR